MRKEKTITLQDDDKSLRFQLRQMSAFDFENWLLRLGCMLRAAGRDIPPGDETAVAGNTILGRNCDLPLEVILGGGADEALGLMNEIFLCCDYVDEQNRHVPLTLDVLECVDQVQTLLTLRCEALRLNLDWALVKKEHAPSLEPPTLPEAGRYQRACAQVSPAAQPVIGLCESLVSADLATLNELKTVYSYWDALELERILRLRNYTKWLAADAAQAERR